MTNDEKMKVFEIGYREGFLFASQALASRILSLKDTHTSWMLDTDRKCAKANIKLTTKNLLVKRGVIPKTYEVLRGKAEDVPIDFNMNY